MNEITDNRANLLLQALRLFAANGYDAVGVQEIAAAGGVTKPTLYHYFGSKRGLLDVLLGEQLLPLCSDIENAVVYEGDLVMNLRRVVQVYFDFVAQRPLLYQFYLSAQHAPRRSEACQAAAPTVERIQAEITRLFELALPHMKTRSGRYAVTFIGMINTYITLALNGDLTLNEELVIQAVHQFMHGIFS